MGLAAVRVGPVGSEWVESRLEVLERAAIAVPGDGGRLLALDASAPSCPRRHGCYKKEMSK